VQRLVHDTMPAGFTSALAGTAREFAESGAQIYLTFLVSQLVIYLVLAAQFESFLDPLTVMFSVPLATLGALGAIWFLRTLWEWTGGLVGGDYSLNLYSQIGIILLVGLVTKNAILLADFANQERARGTPLRDALLAAGTTRFRPILMTSATSVLGAMPLALASSAGAESRQAIGIAVVGGLLFSTVFTLVMIPVVHLVVIRGAQRFGWGAPPPLVELGD
jgi:multidrug efflux pump